MSKDIIKTPELGPEETALLMNDLAKLTHDQRADLYGRVCKSLGLNPLTQPFNYISFQGKMALYASRNCTDQLRKIHDVSVVIKSREKVDDIYVVTARAMSKGREDESIGALPITNLKGEALSNAIMKCETKAKRRVTLSICGLSMMDETEVESIPNHKIVDAKPSTFDEDRFQVITADPFYNPEKYFESEPEEPFLPEPIVKTPREQLKDIKQNRNIPNDQFLSMVKGITGKNSVPECSDKDIEMLLGYYRMRA